MNNQSISLVKIENIICRKDVLRANSETKKNSQFEIYLITIIAGSKVYQTVYMLQKNTLDYISGLKD